MLCRASSGQLKKRDTFYKQQGRPLKELTVVPSLTVAVFLCLPPLLRLTSDRVCPMKNLLEFSQEELKPALWLVPHVGLWELFCSCVLGHSVISKSCPLPQPVGLILISCLSLAAASGVKIITMQSRNSIPGYLLKINEMKIKCLNKELYTNVHSSFNTTHPRIFLVY